MFKHLEDKRQAALIKSVLLQTKAREGRQDAWHERGQGGCSWGILGQGEENPKKKPNKNGAKKNSDDSRDKEDSKERDKKSDDSCMLVTRESFTFSHPSSHES